MGQRMWQAWGCCALLACAWAAQGRAQDAERPQPDLREHLLNAVGDAKVVAAACKALDEARINPAIDPVPPAKGMQQQFEVTDVLAGDAAPGTVALITYLCNPDVQPLKPDERVLFVVRDTGLAIDGKPLWLSVYRQEDTPAAREAIVAALRKPEVKNLAPLPGSALSIEEAAGEDVGCAAVCEAMEDARTVLQGDGRTAVNQKFRIVECLAGHVIHADAIELRYDWSDAPERTERPIAKGERVLWITQRIIGPATGKKALPDTEENRRAATDAVVNAMYPWGEECAGLSARITMPKDAYSLGEPMLLTVEVKNVSDADAPLAAYVIPQITSFEPTDGGPLSQRTEWKIRLYPDTPLIIRKGQAIGRGTDIREWYDWLPDGKPRVFKLRWAAPIDNPASGVMPRMLISNTVEIGILPAAPK